MNKRHWAAAMCALPTCALAGGFQVFAHGARAVGSAFAEQASRDDPSSAWWAPAAFGFMDRPRFTTAVHTASPHGRFESGAARTFLPPPQGTVIAGNNGGSLNDLSIVGNIFYTQPLNDRMSIGLAITQPFGLRTGYQDGWIGRYYALNSELVTVDIGPSISLAATDQLRLGFGLDLQYARAKLSNAIDFSSVCLAQATSIPAFALQCAADGLTVPGNAARDGKATITAASWGWGWNVSAAYAPTPRSLISLTYRSKVAHSFDGDARVSKPIGLPVALATSPAFSDSPAKVDLDLPESVYLSGRASLSDALELNGSITLTRWKRLKELRARLDNGAPDVVTELNWKNAARYSIGISYTSSQAWRWRAGVSYDETPTSDESRTPLIPDSSNTTVALGATYRLSPQASLDVGYAHLFVRDAVIRLSSPMAGNLVGTFKGSGDVLTLQYNQLF